VSVGQQEQRAAADPRPQGKSFTFTFLGVHPKKTFVTFSGVKRGYILESLERGTGKSMPINCLTPGSRLFIAQGFMFGIFIYEQQFAGCFKAH